MHFVGFGNMEAKIHFLCSILFVIIIFFFNIAIGQSRWQSSNVNKDQEICIHSQACNWDMEGWVWKGYTCGQEASWCEELRLPDNVQGILKSRLFRPTQQYTYCLTFLYFILMYDQHDYLTVWISTPAGEEQEIWKVSENISSVTKARVPVKTSESFYIKIIGGKSKSGAVIMIDEIEYARSVCSISPDHAIITPRVSTTGDRNNNEPTNNRLDIIIGVIVLVSMVILLVIALIFIRRRRNCVFHKRFLFFHRAPEHVENENVEGKEVPRDSFGKVRIKKEDTSIFPKVSRDITNSLELSFQHNTPFDNYDTVEDLRPSIELSTQDNTPFERYDQYEEIDGVRKDNVQPKYEDICTQASHISNVKFSIVYPCNSNECCSNFKVTTAHNNNENFKDNTDEEKMSFVLNEDGGSAYNTLHMNERNNVKDSNYDHLNM